MSYSIARENRLASARRMEARHPGWADRMRGPVAQYCPICRTTPTPDGRECGDCISRDASYISDARRD